MKNESEALRSYLAMSLGRSKKRQNEGKQSPVAFRIHDFHSGHVYIFFSFFGKTRLILFYFRYIY